MYKHKTAVSKTELFESIPVSEAVAMMAIPTIISQLVTMVYSMADMFFIGRLDDPVMIAAVSLSEPWFALTTALGNLFGIGGSSLVSRLLGAGKSEENRTVASFSIYTAALIALIYSTCSYLFQKPLLYLLGASDQSIYYAKIYLTWTVALGGVPTVLNLTLAHFLRSEGYTKSASRGIMLGNILNILLDPIFIFVLHMGFTGAPAATALSNIISLLYILNTYRKIRIDVSISLAPKYYSTKYVREIFSVGISSFLASVLANIVAMLTVSLASRYGDAAVAAYGLVKKIDKIPTYICMGLCQGFMPLVGYNFASKNYKRMNDITMYSWKSALIISLAFITFFAVFAPQIIEAFIQEEKTAALAVTFMRIICIMIPFNAINFLSSYTLQAMGKGRQSACLTIGRQFGLLAPCLVLFNHFVGMYGIIWAQPIVEIIMFPVSIALYYLVLRHTRSGCRT